MNPKGRPSVESLETKLVKEIKFLHTSGGFPASIDDNPGWKDIWLEETHHSTALEGNTLNAKEIYRLVEQDIVSGNKEMRHYLEVQGYAQAAKWTYEEAIAAQNRKDKTISIQLIREIHSQLINLVWGAYPPISGDRPGGFRTKPVRIGGASIRLPASGDIPILLRDLVDDINQGPPKGLSLMQWMAKFHADFEVIHPFVDGNGRAGRLLLNYLLIVHGYPPAIILKSQRPRYLRALEKAQAKTPDYTMLTELLVRSVRDNLNKLMLPYQATGSNLLPLSAVAEGTPYQPSYLRRLAQEGKLKAVKDGSLWLSSKKWLKEYIDSRSPRGRR